MLASTVSALYPTEAAAERGAEGGRRRSEAPRIADRPELLPSPCPLPGADPALADAALHTLSVTSTYGELIASEQVGAGEFASALRRCYNQAIHRGSAVVVVDGITHTRNAFLEFVRAFNDCEARSARRQVH